jgi:hypothetical protein
MSKAAVCGNFGVKRTTGRFPRQESEVDPQGIATLSRQLKISGPIEGEAFLVGRMGGAATLLIGALAVVRGRRIQESA